MNIIFFLQFLLGSRRLKKYSKTSNNQGKKKVSRADGQCADFEYVVLVNGNTASAAVQAASSAVSGKPSSLRNIASILSILGCPPKSVLAWADCMPSKAGLFVSPTLRSSSTTPVSLS